MVRRKILNQSAVLVAAGRDGAATKEIASHVEPGDPDNVEARAARFYWSRLFTEFTRDDPAFQGVAPLATYHGEIGSEPTAITNEQQVDENLPRGNW
jgi:hypothetical protein